MIRLITSRWGVGIALLIGLCAWLLVGGAVLIDSFRVNPTPTLVSLQPSTIPTTNTPLPITDTPIVVIPTQSPTLIITTPTALPTTLTATVSSSPATSTAISTTTPTIAGNCAIPAGWVAYTVQPGDTLFGFQLGAGGAVDVTAIMKGNCLSNKLLALGQTVFLPPGAAQNAPKIDDSPANTSGTGASGSLPTRLTRTAKCPCTITVREGWRLEQIAAAVDNTDVGFSGHDFLITTAASAPVPDLAVLHTRPGGKSLEGFMFPGTYTLQNDTTSIHFRDMMLTAFTANVTPKIQADAAAHGLTFWQVIVLASVVQRESYALDEQKLIASTFYNRLAGHKGIASTVTLQYALGHSGNWWPRIVGKTINTDSPYNTNIYGGLPPTPIASPGLNAILATVYPPQTNYQYFSAKCGGGGNFYAVTFAEFEQGLQCGH